MNLKCTWLSKDLQNFWLRYTDFDIIFLSCPTKCCFVLVQILVEQSVNMQKNLRV